MKHVTCMDNNKRDIENYLFGSTCFGGTSPLYYDEDKPGYRMIPRPYIHYKPGSIVYKILNDQQYQDLIKVCELEVMNFLYESLIYYSKHNTNNDTLPIINEIKLTLKLINFIKENVPLPLRIGNSFFTQMVLIGNDEYRKHTGIPCHLDKDRITCIVNFGDVKKGGSTMFYDGLDDKSDIGKLVREVKLSHGRIQVGFFSKVVHSVSAWEGNRMTLNFNFKDDIINHFMNVGSLFYNEFEYHNFPSSDFIIHL